LRSTTSRVLPAQGLQSTELHNDHCSDRSPPWLYPNLFDSNTSCRGLMLSVSWKMLTLSDLAVVRSLANQPTRFTTLTCDETLEPPSKLLREKLFGRPHSRCFSLSSPLETEVSRVGHIPSRPCDRSATPSIDLIEGASNPTPLLPSTGQP
jgi:hypothetical protein